MSNSTNITKSFFAVACILSLVVNAQSTSTTSKEIAMKGKSKIVNTPIENSIMLTAFPYKGDTLPLVILKDVTVVAERTFKNDKDRLAYFILKRNVRKAYPYAVLASVKLKECDAVMVNMPEGKRAAYLKQKEKELKIQFESDLKNLSMSQGRILTRLINRETGMTTFKVIKDYRGRFSAFMWQSLGVLFGNNLKTKYDPSKGEDKLIEEIILQIQDGEV
jgi:hypothetical protein